MIAKRLALFATLLLALATVLWLASSYHLPTQHQIGADSQATRSHAFPVPPDSAASSAQPKTDPIPSHAGRSDPHARLSEAADALRNSSSPEESRRLLDEIRVYLSSLPPDVAVTALRTFLDSQIDAPTKLEFSIAPDGQLQVAPSLRVWLLDCLGQINRDAAAEYARSILAVPGSADEWAVSLRDYALARNAPQDVAFVQGKVREMIHNPAWQQNPTAGFLEAFDTIVHTRATQLTPDLAQLVAKKDNRAVAHAAYLTLDRLVIEEPRTVLAQLAANPDAMQGREQTRANYFARADVRDPQQRELLESYLLDPRRTAQELQTFAGVYPNANFMVSNNLLTKVNTPPQGELAAHDREALKVVEGWLGDPRFTKLTPQIQQIHSRLSTFVGQTEAE